MYITDYDKKTTIDSNLVEAYFVEPDEQDSDCYKLVAVVNNNEYVLKRIWNTQDARAAVHLVSVLLANHTSHIE